MKRQQTQRGSMGTNMRHVHFKPGLMADRDHVAYFGPLMRLEEVGFPQLHIPSQNTLHHAQPRT